MKRFLRVFIALLLLASTTGLAGLLYLPTWLERQILHTLKEVGLPDSKLTVTGVNLNYTTISNLIVDDNLRLTAESVEIRYSLRGLIQRQIDSITVRGLRYNANISPHALDGAPLNHLKFNGGKSTWVIREISIQDATLMTDINHEIHEFSLNLHANPSEWPRITAHIGAFTRHGRGHASFEAMTTIAMEDDHLQVTIDPRVDLRTPDTPWNPILSIRNWPISGLFDARLEIQSGPIQFQLPLDHPEKWICETNKLSVTAGPEEMPFRLKVSGQADLKQIELKLESLDQVKLDHSSITGVISRLDGTITAKLDSRQPNWITPHLSFEARAISIPSIHAAIDRLAGEFPGKFLIESARINGYPPQTAAGLIETNADISGVNITTDWKPHDALPVKLAATVDSSGARFSAKLPPTELVDNRLIATLIPALADLNIDGGIGATIDGEYRHEQLSAKARIDLEDATVQIHRWDVTAYGVGGSIVFDDLLKVRTGPTQILTADRIKIGSIRLTDAQAEFQINSPSQMLLEQISCTIGDYGSLAMHAVSIDTANFNIDTELYIENLNLGDWMSVLTQEKLSATGEIFGRVPVKYRPAEKKLELGNGYLYSGPEGGSLHVNEPRKIVDLLSQYDPRFAEGGQLQPVRIQAQEALNAFDYSLFRFDLVPEAGGGHMLRIETRGKGRAKAGGDKPLEIGSLVVNVHNFQQAVNAFMIGKLQLTQDQSVDRMLERFFQNSAGQENKP